MTRQDWYALAAAAYIARRKVPVEAVTDAVLARVAELIAALPSDETRADFYDVAESVGYDTAKADMRAALGLEPEG